MRLSLILLICFVATCSFAQTSKSDRVYFGGGAGFSFSDNQTNISLNPIVGYRFTSKFSSGIGLTYQYVRVEVQPSGRKETLDNYGWSVFSRYNLTRQFFAQAEYERLSFEYFSDFSLENTDRQGYDSFLLGGGFVETLGGRSSAYITALYNVLYDENDPIQPYSSPWVIRAGVGVGF